jgi:hypothetical protein
VDHRHLPGRSENRELGDTTTLAEPAVVDEIKERSATERDKEE